MTGNLFPARLRASHQDRRITTNFRRNGKLQSCEPCRKGKMRCDHMMPTCGRCARRNKAEQCVYHPAPLTKKALPTPQPTDSEKSTSPTVVLSYESPLFSTVNLPSPARDEVIPQPRVSRASSLPAQNWSSLIYGQRTIEELRRPLPEYQVRVDTLNFEQEAPFVHHAAILAENELNIGIQPPESTPSKIPQSYIDRGATVLTLLKDMPTLQKYINKWFSFARGIIMIEPMVKIYTTSLWSTWHHVLENQKVGDLRTMSEKLWQNTTKPLSRLLKKNTTPTEFCENVTGDNLRWEVVGIIVTLVALLAETLLDGDPIFCSHDEPPVDRAALAVKMHNASEMCVNFCDEFGVLNDLYLWLLHENAVVYCAMRTRGSYENWKKSGTLATALVCCNLHQEIKVDENTPFFITEFRKRLFVCAYSNDKFSASFVGRPPRLTRYYCRLQLPLDLTDAQIMSSGAELDNALGDVDNKGWNRRGLVQRCTFSRVFASNALIMEEILELSLGMLSAEEIIRRAAQIDTIVKANYDELPSFLRMDLEDPWSPNRAPVELLYLAHIKLIRYDHHFLLQRTLVKRAGQDSTALLAVCREMFGFIMEIVNNKDRLRDFQVDFTQIICMDGIPAAAVIAVELLHQWQDPYSASSLTIPLPRSESIQQLSVFVSCLGNIRPESNGYQSGDRGRKFLKKILDTILSPAPLVTIDAGSAGSENPNDPTLTASFLQTGNDGDFMRWLDNMEWDQEGWTNFT